MLARKFSFILGCLYGICLLAPSVLLAAENPSIIIEQPLNGAIFEVQSDITLSGTATPDSEIILSTKDGEYASLRSDSSGKWQYTIPTVSEGGHTIMATVKVPLDSLSTTTASANVTYAVANPQQVAATNILAETGMLIGLAIPVGLLILGVLTYSYLDYRRHRRPLIDADPKAKYSFWHHLHVVSLPLIRYRLSIRVDRRLPNRSDKVRRY